ncbi:hypothetical protein AJ87_10000 [Rhizobium yanglingense]|nr:hypothetical protein AJ87_10000 [Rhizobium yanglingense]
MVPDLAPEESFDRIFAVVSGNLEEEPVASTSALQCHHQAGLFWRASPGGQFEAEGAVPSKGRRPQTIGDFKFRLPDQRAVRKDPKLAVNAVIGKSDSQIAVIPIRQWGPPFFGLGLRFLPFAHSHKFGR